MTQGLDVDQAIANRSADAPGVQAALADLQLVSVVVSEGSTSNAAAGAEKISVVVVSLFVMM